MNRHAFSFALSASAAALLAPMAGAQEGEEFYDGKTVTYVVSTDPGGGYDTYARLVAEFMQEHLPGSTFVVRNMPGAGHIIGANFIANSEPDGLTIGTFNTGLIYAQLAENPAIQFDLREFSWIGKAASDPRVIIVSNDSGIETYEELANHDGTLRFGSAGVGSAAFIESNMLKNGLDLPIEIITGYDGNSDQLAMMRGEVQGSIASRSSWEQFVDEGNAKFVAQVGGQETDVPLLKNLVTTEEGERVAALIGSQGDIGRLTAGPGGIPEDRLQALRDAYEAAVNDPGFLERAEQLGLPVDPVVGEELAEMVRAALDQSPETIEVLKSSLER